MPEFDLESSHPARRIGRCGQCGTDVPLRFAERGELGTTWFCTNCGYQFAAILDLTSAPETRQNVLLAPLRFNRRRLAPPPKVTAEFIAQRLPAQTACDSERRAHPRRAIAAPVAVIPLNQSLISDGEPFMGMAHNISPVGIALIHTRSVAAPYLALELTLDGTTEMHVVIQANRCRAVGLFYEIAGQFLVRIASQTR